MSLSYYYEESGILLVMDDLPGFGANGMRDDTCRSCRGIDPKSWGVGEYLDAFGGMGRTFWYGLNCWERIS